jgi:hypothetical protein
MIKYQLRCDGDHEFEGWFRNSGEFDVQSRDGLVFCPVCGTDAVAKAIMSPAVASSEARAARLEKTRRSIARAAARARDYVEKNFDYVGERFPEEARKIHYGEIPSRGIYGEASGKEVKDLIEEGVEIAPLPGAAAPAAEGEAPAPRKGKTRAASPAPRRTAAAKKIVN